MASFTASSVSLKACSQSPTNSSLTHQNRVPNPSVSFWRTNVPRTPPALRLTCPAAKPETVEKVIEIVKTQLALKDDADVSGETKFTELGADSLDTVEIVMQLEEQFEVTVNEDNAQAITTIHEAAELIDKLCETPA